jgi:hypothetical protein
MLSGLEDKVENDDLEERANKMKQFLKDWELHMVKKVISY